MVKIHKKFMTGNPNYKWNERNKINEKPNKIIIHSTAVQGIMAKDWFSRWNNTKRQVGVHYFVDDKEAWQYLPENYRGWHVGGVWNINSIGIEACEDSGHTREYFDKLIKNYIELVVNIMKRHPQIKVNNIWSHTEAGHRGVGTRSSDPVNHWWYKFGYDMDNFRSDVAKALERGTVMPTPTPTPDKPKPKPEPVKNISKLKIDGSWGNLTTRELQKALGTPVDGIISGQYKNKYTTPIYSVVFNSKVGSRMVIALQKLIGAKVDGYIGKETITKLQRYLGTPVDGIISRNSLMVREMQRRLNAGTFMKDTTAKKYATVKPRVGANVRTGASINSTKAMSALKKGTKVEIVGESSNWYYIRYNGKYGHIRKDLLELQ